MRDISAEALEKIANKYGNSPVNILEISWSDTIENKEYSDVVIDNIPGKIQEITALDNIINVTNSSDSQEITVILDDTDGTIKDIMNYNDIHKRDVWLYQWFEGLPLTDKFLLFKGKINSPIIWNEDDRTVSFSILSQLEDKEVGFSPEEGQFPYIPKELIGKTWPLIFGTPQDVPAVQINKAITGTTLCGVGIISGSTYHNGIPVGGLPPDDRELKAQIRHLSYVSSSWFGVDNDIRTRYKDQYNNAKKTLKEHQEAYAKRLNCAIKTRAQTLQQAIGRGYGCNPLRILGGEDFPRGEITINIGGGLFIGYFESDSGDFKITGRKHIENENQAKQASQANDQTCDASSTAKPAIKRYYFEDLVPPGKGSGGISSVYTTKGVLFPGFSPADSHQPDQTLQQFWADAGSEVTIHGEESIYYIVSIIPGTVRRVQAYKDFHGERKLVEVPAELYSILNITYGSITTVQLKFPMALSKLQDQEWAGDDVYVTFESSIGPNIVDIMTYLINNYSDLAIDTTSFDAVKIKLDPFPANFAILDRTNIVKVLQEIAFQARCSLRISNGVFYLSYLPEEPTSVDVITESDIGNVQVELTSTEDLVTKYTAEWRLSYAQDELDKIILRHNVNKYGIQEEIYEYYIYNQPDIIFKVATFWLIRKANSWKKFSCRVNLDKLALETFDCVTLNFNTNYVADGDIKVIIEQASFNSDDQTIDLQCWTPVKAGSMEEYPFAWPADEEEDSEFPTQIELDAGNGGGNGIGANATGYLPVGKVEIGDGVSIYVGGPNVVFGSQTDIGDRHPTDRGFSAQPSWITSVRAEIQAGLRPSINLSMNYIKNSPTVPLTEHPKITAIVLEETKILTTNDESKSTLLSDIFKFDDETGDESELGIKLEAQVIDIEDVSGDLGQVFRIENLDGDDTLCIKTGCIISDGTDHKEFNFKYDTEGEKWGAGTAFLQD